MDKAKIGRLLMIAIQTQHDGEALAALYQARRLLGDHHVEELFSAEVRTQVVKVVEKPKTMWDRLVVLAESDLKERDRWWVDQFIKSYTDRGGLTERQVEVLLSIYYQQFGERDG